MPSISVTWVTIPPPQKPVLINSEQMDLHQHYQQLYQNSLQHINNNGNDIDTLMNAPDDLRRGITLVVRPDAAILQNIQHITDGLKALDPHQYYHPADDLHVTVMSIITCYSGFDLSMIHLPDYVSMIESCLLPSPDICIRFKGITLSPSCILVQGFMENDTLTDIRQRLRTRFKGSSLQQTIDQRYAIQTAHSTIVRFRQPLANQSKILAYLEQYREHDFGYLHTRDISLLYNDWYHKHEIVQTLHRFTIPTPTANAIL